MHLSGVQTIFSPKGAPYRQMSDALADLANDLIRPYIETSLSDQIRARMSSEQDGDKDDIILFLLLCVLAVEMEQAPELLPVFNSQALHCSDPTIVRPFILVDFPVPCLNGARDAWVFGGRHAGGGKRVRGGQGV